MRYLVFCSCLVLLAGCIPEAEQNVRVHEIEFYDGGDGSRRYSYFYGGPGAITSGVVTLELSEGQSEHDMAVPGALLVNGGPRRAQELTPLTPPAFEVQRAAMSTDMLVRTARPTGAILYFDGSLWFDLLPSAQAGFDTRVVPRPRVDGLRGVGNLTSAEADTFQRALEALGPVALAVLPEPLTPPQEIAGAVVDAYLRTALAVQSEVPTSQSEARTAIQELRWGELASGAQAAGGQGAEFYVAVDREQLLTLWNRAYGARLTPPALPEVDFRRDSVIAVFTGQKPSGGYGVSVNEVRLEGNDVIVNVTETRPGPGDITTQALTHPWVMVQVGRPDLQVAWIRDARSQELLGVAQALGK